MNELKEIITVQNAHGLHVRAATQLVKAAEAFKCEVYLDREGFERVNGKSIMSVLTLAAPQGAEITLITQGEDAETAMNTLKELFQSCFGEKE